jgi:hypothetical protein
MVDAKLRTTVNVNTGASIQYNLIEAFHDHDTINERTACMGVTLVDVSATQGALAQLDAICNSFSWGICTTIIGAYQLPC